MIIYFKKFLEMGPSFEDSFKSNSNNELINKYKDRNFEDDALLIKKLY